MFVGEIVQFLHIRLGKLPTGPGELLSLMA
jgi:hypothetical protein